MFEKIHSHTEILDEKSDDMERFTDVYKWKMVRIFNKEFRVAFY